MDGADLDVDTRCTITQYLTFIQKRASGEIFTLAHWMRAFVAGHPSYKKDSHVNDEIIYDMLKKVRLYFRNPKMFSSLNECILDG